MKIGRQPTISRLPGHLIEEIWVCSRHRELAKLAVELDSERSAEGADGAAQAQQPIADPPLQVDPHRLRSRRRRQPVHPPGKPGEVYRERRRQATVDHARAAFFDDQPTQHDRHRRGARAVGARRRGIPCRARSGRRRSGRHTRGKQGAQRQSTRLVALEQDPRPPHGQLAHLDAIRPVDVERGRGRSIDSDHRPLPVAHVDPRERGVAAHRRARLG